MTSTGFTDDVISLLSVGGEERRAQMLEIFENVDQPLDEFIKDNIIRVTEKAFDDFAGTGSNEELNKRILGI